MPHFQMGSSLANIYHPSANFDERREGKISFLILHYTECNLPLSLSLLCEKSANPVSAHYVIDRNGDVYQLVCESKRAWHAGKSSWKGQEGLNKSSIGIEIVNLGNEPFPKAQMESLKELAKDICLRHKILSHNVLGHSDVAPSRKVDPGDYFDWSYLAQNQIGFNWHALGARDLSLEVQNQNHDAQKQSALNCLNVIGYGTSFCSTPDDFAKLLAAFQMHFVPEERQSEGRGKLTPLTLARLQQIASAFPV